ncbi:hypothetical protein SEA_PUPPER_191 [Gordonia phage Pupper]|uniref:Uncharacterized protein n=1 Tax=Gordonia phage Pupper TaxID=2571249 RepID=A0A4Y6EKV4_9CAUD|nr:hypothetical protein KHQ83_gp086 [Gordonia phage Pupper]QDF18677.1 hypothetical protein SEA_PUPPER_191 [Gordonia phage Pupper]QDF18909.1 hypothetical protein SEA_SCENTAE_190 [Gordonia phage SCentae]
MSDTLTIRDAVALGKIVEWSSTTAKVVRTDAEGNHLFGHARSIGSENGAFIRDDEDIRDAFLRVTSRTGFEHFIPVRELIAEVTNRVFTAYDW